MRHVPTFGLSPRLRNAARLRVIGMNLHGKFLMGKQKLQQQGKSTWVASGIANQVPLILLAELRQGLPSQRAVGNFAIVAGEPGFANLLVKLVVGINRRQIVRAPGAGAEFRQHQEWIEIAHEQTIQIEKAVRERTALAEPIIKCCITRAKPAITAPRKTSACVPDRDPAPPSKLRTTRGCGRQ